MADTSGTSTVTPDYVINEKSADNCVTCLERYLDTFEKTASGALYDSNSFGETTNSLAKDTSAKTIPDF